MASKTGRIVPVLCFECNFFRPLLVFELFQLPPILPQYQPFSERVFVVHQLMGLAIAGLAAAHIGAALYHHFVLKDRVLMRMISG